MPGTGSERIQKDTETFLQNPIDQFLCAVLRGEPAPWPDPAKGYSEAFLDRAAYHGVQPLALACARNNPGYETWPRDVIEELVGVQRDAVAQELLRTIEITKFAGELARRKIDCLVMKGEALARLHYSAPHLRQRCDTDFFIDLKDITHVREALDDMGYRVVPPVYKSHQFVAIPELESNAPILFDVHWRILNAPRFARVLSFAEAMKCSGPVPGLPHCRAPGLEDALLMACMHREGSERHDRNRLIWLYDIHLLAGAMTPEALEGLVEKAQTKGVQHACLEGLKAAEQCFGTTIPARAIAGLAMEPVAKKGGRYARSNLALIVDDLKSLPGAPSKVGLLGELFFPDSDALMRKFKKTSKVWLPVLYLRQLLGGVANRLLLR
jgi:hypothetical protein